MRTGRRVAALIAVTLLLSGCAATRPFGGVTTQGQDIHDLFNVIELLALPVFAIIEVLLLWSVFRYRRRDDAPAPQEFGSNRTLAIFFAIPTLIVAALYPYSESSLRNVSYRDPNPAVTVNVDAFQWEWTFYYQNEGLIESGKTLTKVPVLEVPVDQVIHVKLTSRDVVHEFFVPQILFMRNALPGHTNEFDFTPVKLGTYPGQCAEFCGLYHARMTFLLKVVTASDYTAWIASQRAAALNVSCPSTGSTVHVIAKNISWNAACLGVTAGAPFSVTVDNQDAGIQHNFAIYDNVRRGKQFFQTGRITGPATQTLKAPPLPPGKYYFECNVHGPAMSGTFLVR